MKILLTILFQLIMVIVIIAQTNPNHVWVNGYYRSNGTYVKGHYRTAPNHTNVDNFSTRGNINPYTGEPGSIKPDGQKNPWANELPKEQPIVYEIEPYVYGNTLLNKTNTASTTDNNAFSGNETLSTTWYSKGDQVNVRYSPNTNAKIAYRINKGDKIDVLRKSESMQYISGYGEDYWYEIRFNNLTGWVFGKLIGTQNFNTSSMEDWNGEYLTITQDFVNVRTEPSTIVGKVKTQLHKDQQVEVLAKTTNKYEVNGYGEDFWYYIKADNIQGWVFGKLTKF